MENDKKLEGGRKIEKSYPPTSPVLFLEELEIDGKTRWKVLYVPKTKSDKLSFTYDDLESAEKLYSATEERLKLSISRTLEQNVVVEVTEERIPGLEDILIDEMGDKFLAHIEQFPDNINPVLSFRQISVYYKHDPAKPIKWCVIYRRGDKVFSHEHFEEIEDARKAYEKIKARIIELDEKE